MAKHGQRIRHIRRWGMGALAGVLLSGSAMGQDGIERARLQRALADQKATVNVAEAMQDADGLSKVSQQKAVERLKQSILALDLSTEISTAKRKELIEQLQAKINLIETRGANVLDPKTATVKQDARKAYDAALLEATEVAKAITKADQLIAQGRSEEARRVIGEAAYKYPSNPSLMISQSQETFAAQIRAEKQLSKQFADAWVKNTRDVAASAIPATGDIQFPDRARWAEITKLRQQPAVKLTPKEEKILESLNKTVGANFKDRIFEEALQELSNQIDQPIFIDKKSLEDLGLDLSRKVNFQGSVSGRTALRAVLQSMGLTFVVKDEMIQVLTLEKAQQTLVTRSYYLGDLVAGNGPFGNAVQWGPFASYQQTMQNAQLIIDAVTSSVDPMAWSSSKYNGPCTISFNLPTMSIVVRASAEVHATLGSTLSTRK